jgi:hypothetical protein
LKPQTEVSDPSAMVGRWHSLIQQEEKMARIPKQWRPKPRSCGSGKLWSPQYDARGIFLTYTCEDCHDGKMAGYRPDVLTDPSYWTEEPIDED